MWEGHQYRNKNWGLSSLRLMGINQLKCHHPLEKPAGLLLNFLLKLLPDWRKSWLKKTWLKENVINFNLLFLCSESTFWKFDLFSGVKYDEDIWDSRKELKICWQSGFALRVTKCVMKVKSWCEQCETNVQHYLVRFITLKINHTWKSSFSHQQNKIKCSCLEQLKILEQESTTSKYLPGSSEIGIQAYNKIA